MRNISWSWKTFQELTTEEIYQIIRVRETVFVVEQKISYVDCDGLDQKAWHLMGMQDGKLVAYLRAFAPGTKFPEASLGRVLTMTSVRGQGVGRELMQQGLQKILTTFGPAPIRISAQAYLQKFYEELGFKVVGDGYIEEGLPHVRMIRP